MHTLDPSQEGESNTIMLSMEQFIFCPACGASLQLIERQGTPRLTCLSCGYVRYRNPAVGVAVIIMDGARVLMVRRARGEYKGLWCFPCGYVEWGEEVRAAARRELQEETGLDAEVGAVFAVHSNFHNLDSLTVGSWFRGTIIGGALQPGDDADAVDYFPLDAPPPLAFPTDHLVLGELRGSAL